MKTHMHPSVMSRGLRSPDRIVLQDGGLDSPTATDKGKGTALSVKIPRKSAANASGLSQISRRTPAPVRFAEAPGAEESAPSPLPRGDEPVQKSKSFKVNRVDFVRGKIPTNNSPITVRVLEGEILPDRLSQKKFSNHRKP